MSDDLKPVGCDVCDFGSGTRGMDRCSKCKGTGSVFWVDDNCYPNTREGYIDACMAAGVTPVLE